MYKHIDWMYSWRKWNYNQGFDQVYVSNSWMYATVYYITIYDIEDACIVRLFHFNKRSLIFHRCGCYIRRIFFCSAEILLSLLFLT